MADATAPKGFALTTDGDLEIPLRLISGVEWVTQTVRVTVQLFHGEWFADESIGIPYFQSILGQKYSEAEITKIFAEEILEISEINQILELSTSYNGPTRTLSVTFRVNTVFGEVSDSVEIIQ